MTRVLAAGLAATTSRGAGVASLREAVEVGSAGAEPGRSLTLPEIDVDIDPLLRATRTRHPPTMQLLAAVERGLGDVLRGWPEPLRRRASITLANTSTGVGPHVEMYEASAAEGRRAINPAQFPTTMLNYPATQLARAFGLTGPNTTVGSSTGVEALDYTLTRLEQGRDPVALVGGIEVLPPRAPDDDPSQPPHAEAIALLLLGVREALGDRPALAMLEGWASVPASADPVRDAVEAALDAAGRALETIALVITESAEPSAILDDVRPHVGLAPVLGRCLAAAAPLSCVAAIDAVARGSGPTLVVTSAEPTGAAAFVFAPP